MSDEYASAIGNFDDALDDAVSRALREGLTIDDVIKELDYQLKSLRENRAEYL